MSPTLQAEWPSTGIASSSSQLGDEASLPPSVEDPDDAVDDIERQFLAERPEVLVRLHEGVLHRLVGFRRIAQVVIRDPRGAPLVPRHQLGVAFARDLVLPVGLPRLDGGGSGGVRFACGDECR